MTYNDSDWFDTTPKPAFLRAMQNQKWNASGALAELVDNSFGPGRGNADYVHITHNLHDRTISVLDNGVGMEAIGRLFQLGNTIGRSPGDIGIWGSGGTMAIMWLPRDVHVWTLRDGMISHDTVNWAEEIKAERFPIISNTWKTATAANTPSTLYDAGHGTLIVLHLLSGRQVHVGNIKRELSRMYSPALRHGKKITWTTIGKNGGTDTFADPFVFSDDPVKFDVTIDMSARKEPDLHLKGEIGVVTDLPQDQSRISIGFGSRIIATTRDCFSSADGTERYSGVGVTGWLDLADGWQPYLSTTKDAINDDVLWDVLMDHVFGRIKHLLAKVDKQKLNIILTDLQLNLEPIFDSDLHQDVDSAGESKDKDDPVNPPEPDPHPSSDDSDSVDPPKPNPIDEDGDDTARPEPRKTKIEIVEMTDIEMQGVLCNAEASDRGVEVFINTEHETVKQAMIAKPVNRQMLNFMVVREIASALAENMPMAKKIFPPRAVKQIEAKSDPRTREGLITRMLMDRVAA